MHRKLNSSRSCIMQSPLLSVGLLCTVALCVLGSSSARAALPPGLEAYYRLNSTSGLAAIDETGKHNGTLTGALNWVPGVEGNALQFRGGNGSPFVNLGAWQTTGPAGLSLALWVKWAGPNTLYQGLMCQRDGTMYWWVEIATDAAQLRFKSNTSPQSNLYLTTPHLIQNEWMHVAFSHDAAAKKGAIYLNGTEKLSGAWSLPTGTFSNRRAGIGVVNTADGLGTFNGTIDEAMIFQVPLTVDDVKQAMRGYSEPVATDARPGNGQTDVPRDTSLSWSGASTAGAHDVYFGTSAEAVGSADRANPLGVLVSQAQEAAICQPAGPLEFGKTYYWRVDEVNAPPAVKVFKGQVWSFTVEPYAYAIKSVTATASSAQASMGPEKTVDGSGLTGDQHGTEPSTMWLSSGAQPNWIQYEFDKAYKLHEMWVWNSNQMIETFFGLGVKKVAVEYSADGVTWTPLGNVPEFARAPGAAAYGPNTTISFGGVSAQFVRLTTQSTWGGMPAAGLSEVRFFSVPVQARAPQPATAVAGVGVDTDLSWRPGRDATSHKVYFGTDQAAVANGTAPVKTETGHSFDAGALDFGTTYYWRVDEVNATTYPGEVWSFSTVEYAGAEDFESYTDKAGNSVFDIWIDGYTNGNGSLVGYLNATGGTFCETQIVHGGKQSMPFEYNNVKTPFYSEAERAFDTPQDWTVNGANTLALWYIGYPAGFVDQGDNAFAVSSTGSDIWNNADQFRFAYKQLSGNGSITAKVDSLVRSDGWAKAGVMIRETLDANSKQAMVVVTPDNSCAFQRRETSGGGSAGNAWTGAAVKAPYWVRITRTGNSFKGETSPDGKTWTALGADATISMAANVTIGLAITSHNPAAYSTAQFSNVATTGTVTGAWQNLSVGVIQRSNDPAPLYVVVEDKAGKKKTVTHSDPAATTAAAWTQWRIPLTDLAGVNLGAVKKLTIGVGDRANPKPGPAGMLYLDDIQFGHPIQ